MAIQTRDVISIGDVILRVAYDDAVRVAWQGSGQNRLPVYQYVSITFINPSGRTVEMFAQDEDGRTIEVTTSDLMREWIPIATQRFKTVATFRMRILA